MWPWEHLAVGYLCYSVAVHAVDGHAPDGQWVLLLALGTQVPDLVDKPLAWSLDVFAVGYGPAHSVLVVGPALCVAAAVAVRERRGEPAVAAFGIGWLSHLAGDLVYPVLRGDPVPVGRVLWPVASFPGPVTDRGLVERALVYFLRYLAQILSLEPSPLLVVQIGLVTAVGLLWLADGAPGPLAAWRLLDGR
ncbi:metal-dependent hydrolase [Halosimplex amylolyticum]|uniref:metal-dependent hydrolase n=1 Tax=Halosimplex amylolyticum TaxID=3396616 RepID=UPI003F5790A3